MVLYNFIACVLQQVHKVASYAVLFYIGRDINTSFLHSFFVMRGLNDVSFNFVGAICGVFTCLL